MRVVANEYSLPGTYGRSAAEMVTLDVRYGNSGYAGNTQKNNNIIDGVVIMNTEPSLSAGEIFLSLRGPLLR